MKYVIAKNLNGHFMKSSIYEVVGEFDDKGDLRGKYRTLFVYGNRYDGIWVGTGLFPKNDYTWLTVENIEKP